MKHLPISPIHPERVCWGCESLCRADDMQCGNGTIRTPHPIELFGEGWNQEFSAEEGSPEELERTRDRSREVLVLNPIAP